MIESRIISEALRISERQRNTVSEAIEQIVVTVDCFLVADAKAADLACEMIARDVLISRDFLVSFFANLDHVAVHIAADRDRAFVFSYRGELRVDRACRPASTLRL